MEAKGSEVKGGDPWVEEPKGDIFEGINKETMPKAGGVEDWETAEGFEPWSLGGGDDDGKDDVFGIGDAETVGFEGLEMVEEGEGKSEEMMELERKEQDLLATLKGNWNLYFNLFFFFFHVVYGSMILVVLDDVNFS